MRHIILPLVCGFFLTVVSETCPAVLMVEGMTKERAEKELGVVIKREFLGLGSITNEAGISIEFAPIGKLERFIFVILDIYLERPDPNERPITRYRRLTSVTLKPVVQTREKVRVFFSVDPQYLDRTDISIRVDSSGKLGPDGYSISLDPKDFPAPKADNGAAVQPAAGMQIRGRPVAAWVADVDIERGLLDTDPALDVLVSAGPKVLPHLAEILRHDLSTTQQAKAADAMNAIAYRNPGAPELLEVVPAFADGTKSKALHVRRFSIQGLAAIGKAASNSIPALIRSTEDQDGSARMCAVEALGRIGLATPEAEEALKNRLSDSSGDVRVAAIQALYQIGKPATNAVPVLIQLTTNESVGVRCFAVETLGRVGTNSPEAVVALKRALNDESELFVRPLAREALMKVEAKDK